MGIVTFSHMDKGVIKKQWCITERENGDAFSVFKALAQDIFKENLDNVLFSCSVLFQHDVSEYENIVDPRERALLQCFDASGIVTDDEVYLVIKHPDVYSEQIPQFPSFCSAEVKQALLKYEHQVRCETGVSHISGGFVTVEDWDDENLFCSIKYGIVSDCSNHYTVDRFFFNIKTLSIV